LPRPPTPPQDPPQVGARLAALRQRRGQSLDELSRQAGVSKSMLSQIERNQANPTVAVVWRLAAALGVTVADLLDGGRAAAP
jgi:transcriptional regulator with XRE-family HTH domain